MASIGQILSEKRKELGLSLKDIQEKTKINIKYLQALETEEFEKIPGEAYVRAFLREYAENLGIDGQALLAQYKKEREKKEEVLEEEIPLSEKEKTLTKDLTARPRSKWLFAAIVAGLMLIIFGYLGWLGRGLPQTKTPKPKPITTPQKEEKETEKKATTPSPPPAPSGVNLSITIVESRCWLEVETDGNLVYSGIMEVGETKSWRGEKTLLLRAASGRRIKATFNGKDLGTLNETGQTIEVVFTPEGIQQAEGLKEELKPAQSSASTEPVSSP